MVLVCLAASFLNPGARPPNKETLWVISVTIGLAGLLSASKTYAVYRPYNLRAYS